MARPTLLEKNPGLQDKIAEMLAAGVTVRDVCASVNISERSYYGWRQRGEMELERRSSPRVKKGTATWNREQPFVQFFQATTRAEGQARIHATTGLEKGMLPSKEIHRTTETVTETRLKKDGTPYDYTKTIVRETVIERPGDWRAALEYLKRRDSLHWSEHTVLRGEDAEGKPTPVPIMIVEPSRPPGSDGHGGDGTG